MEIENKVEDRVELGHLDDRIVNVDRIKAQPPRDFLERYFAEQISSLKSGLDEVYKPSVSPDGEELTRLQSIKAYWNICRTEMDQVVELFGHVQPATLSPNHRLIMEGAKWFNELLQSNDIIEAKQENGRRVKDFARWAIAYLTMLHTCLSNDPKITKVQKRKSLATLKEFKPYGKN